MKAVRRIGIWLGICIAMLIGIHEGVLYLMSRPQPAPVRGPLPDYSAHRLEEKVGEYVTNEGERLLVTYAPAGGLAIYNLVGRRSKWEDYRSKSFVPGDDGSFEWLSHHDDSVRSVWFTKAEESVGFGWEGEAGLSGHAIREPNRFSLTELRWENGEPDVSSESHRPLGCRSE